MEQTKTRKKLIEVALPLDKINAASAREKSISYGHPSTLHLWWARRPWPRRGRYSSPNWSTTPPICRKSSPPRRNRKRNGTAFSRSSRTWCCGRTRPTSASRRRPAPRSAGAGAAPAQTTETTRRAAELFDPDRLPAFHDPFAGGGSIPLEAQRLGLESYASDLNPVAVLINKAMIEIPPKFAGRAPVNPERNTGQVGISAAWKGATGLAEDVRYYGKWMRDEAEKRIGHLYPKIDVTAAMAEERPDLKRYVGRKLTTIAWLWARTVRSPNPAFADVEVPLASTFILSKKKGKEAYVEPVIGDGGYHFTVRAGTPPESARKGTKLSRGSNFQCVMSGVPMNPDYIKAEGMAGRMGARLMAIVAEGDRGRVYVTPLTEHESIVAQAKPEWEPKQDLPNDPRAIWVPLYGLTTFADLFTDRQLVALTTFSDLVGEAVNASSTTRSPTGMPDDGVPLRAGGTGATAYAEAVGVYLGLCVSRQTNRSATLNFWATVGEKVQQVFARQALAMTWDFVESNPMCNSSGNFVGQVGYLAKVLETSISAQTFGSSQQLDAQSQEVSLAKLVATDPLTTIISDMLIFRISSTSGCAAR